MTLIRPLVWPSGVPRTKSRRNGRFTSNGVPLTVSEALDRLDNELGAMNARNVEVCADFAATKGGNVSQSEAKGADAGVVVKFTRSGVAYELPCDTYISPFYTRPDLLGPVNLGGSLDADRDNPCGCGDGECHECWRSPSAPAVHWVICGGESGPHARPMHPDWARSLRDQCIAAGVPFLFKQWGEWQSLGCAHSLAECGVKMGANSRVVNFAGGHGFNGVKPVRMARVGKKAAGRLLDGRTWDQFPEVRP